MKKGFLKFFVVVLTVCFMLGCIPANAASERVISSEKVLVDEYEYITSIQKMSKNELKEMGYSDSVAEEMHAFSYREALYERAKLPESSLKNLGYSDRQIEFMKDFLADPDGDYDFSVLAISLSSSIVLVSGANSSVSKTVRYQWSWSASPLVLGNDSAGVRWQGFDRNGHSVDMTSYESGRYGSVNYYNDYGFMKTENLTIKSASGFNSLNASFRMKTISNGENLWAKSGSITCKLDKPSSGNAIEYIKFQGTYGHATINPGTLSVDYSGTVGLSFSWGCENYYKTAEIRSSVVYI